MEYLDRTLPSPEENLALEESLLEECERTGRETLRVWEARRPVVVVGRSNRTLGDVNLDACRRRGIPVLRRPSGGGSVVLGPGCLNYALVLSMARDPRLAAVRPTNAWIMERLRRALAAVSPEPVTVEGFTDLAVRGRKFSGNAQHRRRGVLLFHGTVILDDREIGLIEELLDLPERMPAYRRSRSHAGFLTALGVSRPSVREALFGEWVGEAVGAEASRR